MGDTFDGLSGKRVAVILPSVFERVWATRDGAFICTGLHHARRQAVLIALTARLPWLAMLVAVTLGLGLSLLSADATAQTERP